MELRLEKNRLSFLFLLYFICAFLKINAQITLNDELKKVSQTKNDIVISKTSKAYVKLGEKGIVSINFLKKNIKLNALYFSSVDDLFFYILMTEDEIYSNKKSTIIYCNTVLMFDKKNDKIFFLEYGFDGASILKLTKKNFTVMNDFEKNISRIVMVNKSYIPDSSLSVEYIKSYSLFSFEKYFFYENNWHKKVNLLNHPIYDFNNLSYNDFLQLISGFKENSYKSEECKLNDNFIFFKFK